MCNLNNTKEALIKTMCFFDIFDFSLTKEELCDYMLFKKCDLDQLQDFIDHQEFILESNNYVYFRARPITLKIRKDKEIRAQKLIRRAKRYVKFMQLIPFVRTVALCNSLSFYAAEKGSDIDLFVITEKNRLYIARTFAWIFTHVMGIRRHGKKIAGRFCLSFMISKDNMDLTSIKNDEDIYLAFWLRLLRPLIGQNTYKDFIKSNKWIKQYFDYEIDQQIHLIEKPLTCKKIQKILEFPIKGWFGNLLEKALKKWQMSRCKKKTLKLDNSDGIVIKDCMLKFHDIDMRETYQKLWAQRFNQFTKYLSLEDDSENEYLKQSRQNRRLYESRFQDTEHKKNEKHLPDSQKIQTQVD